MRCRAQDLATREIVDSLSEKNLEQFTLDQWIALYRHAKEVQQNKQIIYQRKPDERTPHEILYTDIEVSPGVPWVSREIIEEFIFYLCSGDKINLYRSGRKVNYEPVTGNWFITDKQYHDNNERERLCYTYGLPDYNALHIFEATLNLREIKRFNNKNQYDEAKTLVALEKQEIILALFREWIWQDEDRRWEVEEAYNKLFEAYQAKHYDGSALIFPDMSDEITLYPYQKDAVKKIISEKTRCLLLMWAQGKHIS